MDTALSIATDEQGMPGWNAAAAQRRAETEALGEQIAELAAQIHAATFRLLELVRKFNERSGWGDGFLSCAHWLSWRTGIGLVAARAKVRVALALPKLPKVSQAFRVGRISYSKVRAITRVATAKSEEMFLLVAENASASHVEKVVQKYRSVKVEEQNDQACAQREQRLFRGHYDGRGMYRFQGRLPAEAGAVLERAMRIAEDQLLGAGAEAHPDDSAESSDTASSAPKPTAGQRRADALLLLADSALDNELKRGSGGDRMQVVVHVDAAALKDENQEGVCHLEDGPNIAPQTARRLSCDATVVPLLETSDGKTLDIHAIGRKRRTIAPSTLRALRARATTCAFPGCSHHRFLEAHHVKHWIDGGTTNLENLLVLCSTHHFLLHEGGYRLELDDEGQPRFLHPTGARILEAPTLSPPPDVDDLYQTQRELAIDADTVGVWGGERLDYDLIIEGISQFDNDPGD